MNLYFDNTPESLIPLWEWYEQKITMVDKTEEEYQKEREETPDYIEVPKTKISMETWKIGMDLALYFADVMIRNNTGKVYWGYFTKPKNRMSVKRPVLLGFKADMDLDPRLIVVNCTSRSSRSSKKQDYMKYIKRGLSLLTRYNYRSVMSCSKS